MEYITTRQAAEKWNISDRRVRILCAEGKIFGTVKEGKTYKIPVSAMKPADGRRKHIPYYDHQRALKWGNEMIGMINEYNAVFFIKPDLSAMFIKPLQTAMIPAKLMTNFTASVELDMRPSVKRSREP